MRPLEIFKWSMRPAVRFGLARLVLELRGRLHLIQNKNCVIVIFIFQYASKSFGMLLNLLLGIFGGSSPQMRAVFETGADLGLAEGEKMQGREKSLGPE